MDHKKCVEKYDSKSHLAAKVYNCEQEISSAHSTFLKEMEQRITKNFLDVIVLAKLRNSEGLSGYDFMDLVHKEFDMLVSSGTVYSLLYSMERRGLISGDSSEGKRVYVLTDKGAETLTNISRFKEEIQKVLQKLLEG